MTSIIRADNISTVAGAGNISLNTGNKIVSPDVGGIVAPGHTIQVVTSSLASTVSYSTGLGEDNVISSGLTCTITPKFANSIILVSFQCFMGSSNYQTKILLGRTINGGANTYIGRGNAEGSRPRATASVIAYDDNSTVQGYLLSYIGNTISDNPSTTSAITYTIYFGGYNTHTAYINRSHLWQNSPTQGYDAIPTSNMQVMEIAQ